MIRNQTPTNGASDKWIEQTIYFWENRNRVVFVCMHTHLNSTEDFICIFWMFFRLCSSSGWKHPTHMLCCYSLRSTPSFYYSKYTLTLTCTFLLSGNIKYDLQSDCSKGQQKTPAVYQVYFCKVFLLLQPSVEGYIVSLKTQTPE